MSHDHAWWADYIAKGRNKHDRPIRGSRTKRAYLYADGRIGLRLHSTDVVTLFPDGIEAIYTGGWNTITTKAFIAEHSKARVWSEKGQLFVRALTPEITPPRVQKCRQCKGEGQIQQFCAGPDRCYPYYFQGHDLGHRCEHGHAEAHKREACPHGRPERHAIDPYDCYRCSGTGRADYGSKAIHYKWDGTPLRIDEHGYPLGPVENAAPITWAASFPEPYTTTIGSPKPKAPTSGYGDSGNRLAAILPGLAADVSCPSPTCGTTGSVHYMVIHLNDVKRWTREQIADWLDSLDVDLSFPVPDTIPAHIH